MAFLKTPLDPSAYAPCVCGSKCLHKLSLSELEVTFGIFLSVHIFGGEKNRNTRKHERKIQNQTVETLLVFGFLLFESFAFVFRKKNEKRAKRKKCKVETREK